MNTYTTSIRQLLLQMKSTALTCAKQVLDGGIASSLASYFVRLVQFIVFILLWKSFSRAGVDLGGMSEAMLLTYTLLSFCFRRQLDIITPATSALWEGSIIGRFTRPMSIYASLIAETIGKWWVPYFLFFSLPLFLGATLLGISPLPASFTHGMLFLLSLVLSIIIGFGLDMAFSSIAIRMKNCMWMATRLREVLLGLLSGALIPFSLFPKPVAQLFSLLPFGSIASAPLSIYVGSARPFTLLTLQMCWAIIMTILGHLLFQKSQERMVSYGG